MDASLKIFCIKSVLNSPMDHRLNPTLAGILPPSDLSNLEVRRVRARELLKFESRFDLAAKCIYAQMRLSGLSVAWIEHAYLEHLRAFNDLVEDDLSAKRDKQDFLSAFNSVIDSMAGEGFRHETSLIPVDRFLHLIDGAHRIAAAAVLDLEVSIAVMPTWIARKYDYKWFESRGFPNEIALTIASELPKFSASLHVAVVFPVADGLRDELHELLTSHAAVVCNSQFDVDPRSAHVLVRELYWAEPWLGTDADLYRGALSKAEACCGQGGKVEIILFHTVADTNVRALKELVRDLYGKGKHSIHIDDGGPEALRMSRCLLHPGSAHFIRHATVICTPRFDALARAFHRTCLANSRLAEDHCLDGGASMAAYGLRDCEDLDVISGMGLLPTTGHGVNRRTDVISYYQQPAENIIGDLSLQFWHRGLRFLNLAAVSACKRRRMEGKDTEDLVLIGRLAKGASVEIPLGIRLRARAYRLDRSIRRSLPRPVKRFGRLVKKVMRRASGWAREIPDWLGDGPLEIRFANYSVTYLRGDSLVRRIRATGTYEPETTAAAAGLLTGRTSPLVLDVGANIGLFSLALMAVRPDVRIHAFEPGPLQHALLQRTLTINDLSERVALHDFALADVVDTKTFSVHVGQHSSGDGFKDTGRAGPTETINVRVDTLDHWWVDNGRPSVDLIKLDAEGAEHMILRGGSMLLREVRPPLLIEINVKNLRAYDLEPRDIESVLSNLGYELRGMHGEHHPDIAASGKGGDDMFIAIPSGGKR